MQGLCVGAWGGWKREEGGVSWKAQGGAEGGKRWNVGRGFGGGIKGGGVVKVKEGRRRLRMERLPGGGGGCGTEQWDEGEGAQIQACCKGRCSLAHGGKSRMGS